MKSINFKSDKGFIWINKDIKTAYKKLFELGYVHSVEVWNKKDELVGGLYGVEVNGLFAGESMFHKQTDASKTAMVYLVNQLKEAVIIPIHSHYSSLEVIYQQVIVLIRCRLPCI